MLNITDGFYVNYAAPVDYRMIATNSTVRNSIVYKYDGMKVFQTDDRNTYVWTTSSSSWVIEYSTMIIGTGSLNYVPKVVSTFPYVNYDNSSIYVNSGGYVGIGTNDPKGSLQIGSSNPLTIYKGTSTTTIGSNWWYTTTDQYFSTTDGSSNIIFSTDGSILIKNRPGSGSMGSSIQFNSDKNTYILQNTLYLKGRTDTYNGLKWSSSFGSVSVMNGPSLFGQSDGVLGTRNLSSANTAVVYWKETEIQLLKDTYMRYNTLYLGSDQYHGISLRSSFGGYTLDGPAIFGYGSGVLGTSYPTSNVALHWNSSNNVGIGTSSNTIYKLKSDGVIQGRSTLTKTVGAQNLYIGSSVWNGNVHLLTGHLNNGSNYGIIQVALDSSYTNGNDILSTPYNLVLQPGGGNVRIGSSGVVANDQSINSGSPFFPNTPPKLEILTNSNTISGAYSDCVVIRNDGRDITTAIRRLGLLMKLSDENSINESNKMGGMMLESNQPYANSPNLYFLTANQKRLGIDYNGNVDVISGNLNVSTGDLYVNSGNVNISTGNLNVSTIIGNLPTFNLGVNGNVQMLNTGNGYPRPTCSNSNIYAVYGPGPSYSLSPGTYRSMTNTSPTYTNQITATPYDRYISVLAQMHLIKKPSPSPGVLILTSPVSIWGSSTINFSIGGVNVCTLRSSIWYYTNTAVTVTTSVYDDGPTQRGGFFVPAGVTVDISMSVGLQSALSNAILLIDDMREFKLGR